MRRDGFSEKLPRNMASLNPMYPLSVDKEPGNTSKNSLTTWQLIRMMLQKGYTLETGPHFKRYRGYWARFVPTKLVGEAPKCDECGQTVIFDHWDKAGHALTAHRAIVMAAKIALGKSVSVPMCESFKL